MADKKNRNKGKIENERFEIIGESVSKTEEFINKNKNIIIAVIAAIILIVGGIFSYKKLYLGPRENEALADQTPAL